jgi:hypothetical protein
VAGSGKHHRDEALIAALAAGGNAAAAARQAGVNERTVRRRLADPAFRARVDEARAELVRAAIGRLATIGTLAADKLQDLIGNARSEQVQLGAARAALEFMLKGSDTEVLARQLAELREHVEVLRRERGSTTAPSGPAAGGPEGDERGGQPPAGEAQGGPGSDLPGGGHDPRPLAEDASLLPFV